MKTRHVMRTFVLTLVSILVLPLVSALSASAADLKPYRVGYNSWIGYIALFVAEDKGYFKDEGLDVQAKSFSAPGDGLTPLLAGDLDAHLSTLDSVITVLDKAPGQLKIIYFTDTSAGADAILAKPDITDVKQLKGRTVAATIGQCNELLLVKALEKSGMTLKDVKLINMNPDDAGSAFAAGKLDVAVTWEPWITKASAQKAGHVIFSSKDLPNILTDVLVVNTDKVNTAETKAFVRALNKANEFVIAHPDEAAKIGAKSLEDTPADIADMLTKVKLYGKKDNLALMKGPEISVANEIAEFFKDQKVNDTLVDTSGLYDLAYLR
jgi:NitT/TauT family transport system substrate-binding protein